MKKSMCLLLFLVFLAGCTKEDIPEEKNAAKITEAVLVPFGQGEKQEMKFTGLAEVLENKEVMNAELSNTVNSRMDNELDNDGSLFCVDENTGVVYFVNQNKDFYLYRIKDGEVALAVEMPVREVHCYQNEVYFMIESYGKYELTDIHEGEIYCYRPADGSIRLIYSPKDLDEIESAKVKVTDEGIYFMYMVSTEMEYEGNKYEMKSIQNWYLPHGEKTPQEDMESTTYVGWRDYMIVKQLISDDISGGSELCLMKRDGSGEQRRLGFLAAQYCVLGDWLCYIQGSDYKVKMLHLETGEMKEFDFEEQMLAVLSQEGKEMQEDNQSRISAFTVTHNGKYLWAVAWGTYLYRMDTETGEIKWFSTMNEIVDRLYTDGEKIYAMCKKKVKNPARLVLMTEVTDILIDGEKIPVINVENLTE